jgi:hypothetical protein
VQEIYARMAPLEVDRYRGESVLLERVGFVNLPKRVEMVEPPTLDVPHACTQPSVKVGLGAVATRAVRK